VTVCDGTAVGEQNCTGAGLVIPMAAYRCIGDEWTAPLRDYRPDPDGTAGKAESAMALPPPELRATHGYADCDKQARRFVPAGQ